LIVENGEAFGPGPAGRASVIVGGGRILAVGRFSAREIASSGLSVETLDAAGCIVTPGLIDPHEHLTGGSGERGFASQTPEIFFRELVEGGITTVVGCLGVDTSTRTMPALLAKVKSLRAGGLTAFLYTGGYPVPPQTLTGSPQNDILFIEEIIGIGETAISDYRSSRPSVAELARLASAAHNAGILSGKAGLLHLHTGDDPARLAPVRALLDEHHIPPAVLYPTHVERSPELFDEAIELTRRGVRVDIDVMEHDLARWAGAFRERGGVWGHLTASSDAAIASPGILLEQVRDSVCRGGIPLEEILPLVTANSASVLRLPNKGRLEPGCDADILVLEAGTLRLRHVLSMGRVLMRDGVLAIREEFLNGSERRIHLDGTNEARTAPE
jgi:beta-aspartyl-dipeptidase (metallo-type)